MTGIHLLAGVLVTVAVPVTRWFGSTQPEGASGWLMIFVVGASLTGISLAAPGVLLARAVWWLSTRRDRDPVAEVMAVVLGALVGSAAVWPNLVWMGQVMGTDFIQRILLTVLIGVVSGFGFAIWVLRAWYPRRVAANTGELPVN